MSQSASIVLDPEFAPCEGGPQYHLERVFGVPRGIGFVRFGFAVSAVMWVPLLVLSAWEARLKAQLAERQR